MCDEHSEWDITQANRVIINIFVNNEQQIKGNIIRKEAIKSIKSRQTMKRKYKENLYILIYFYGYISIFFLINFEHQPPVGFFMKKLSCC